MLFGHYDETTIIATFQIYTKAIEGFCIEFAINYSTENKSIHFLFAEVFDVFTRTSTFYVIKYANMPIHNLDNCFQWMHLIISYKHNTYTI